MILIVNMIKTLNLEPVFVDCIPKQLEDGYLYISMTHQVAIHRCACGCGEEVVTPIAADQWHLHYDGTITLSPSIGNWQIPCQSHYWIRNNHVIQIIPSDNANRNERKTKKKKSGKLKRELKKLIKNFL